MSIWFRQFTTEEVDRFQHDTMGSHLGIEVTEIGSDYLEARMPHPSRQAHPGVEQRDPRRPQAPRLRLATHHRYNRAMRAALALMVAIGVTGCGQTGPLFGIA
jgi:hypothetical protein